jgi:hypothetical protein
VFPRIHLIRRHNRLHFFAVHDQLVSVYQPRGIDSFPKTNKKSVV